LRQELAKRFSDDFSKPMDPDSIFSAVQRTMTMCKGGYSVVILIHDVGIVGFRDPWGIRPVVFGSRASSTLKDGIDYCIASESTALDTLGFKMERDIKPGECILTMPMDPENPRANLGFVSRQLVGDGQTMAPCLFEYVYFARPDSTMNNVSVYQSRINMGIKLAHKIRRCYPDEEIDVVIPIPDTSRTSALACANTLGLPYFEGFIKNRYIGRTFIMPGQAVRKKSVKLKLNTIKSEFEGKKVLLVDDSIVRGTTSTELVQMAYDAGAKKVFFVSAAPMIQFPNVYGIDLPSQKELIAYNRNESEIANILKCEWVLFQDLNDLEQAVRECNPDIEKFEGCTFTGDYVTNDIDSEYFKQLHQERNDAAKEKKENAP